MAVGDVYEVIDVQTFKEQQVLNVYFYIQQAAFIPLDGTIAQNIADEWNDSVLPWINACQNSDITHIETRVRNLFDPVDQGISISGNTGSGGGATESLPTFNAWGFGLNTDNASVRPGAKRIAGVGESDQADGVPIPAMVTTLNAAAEALAAPLVGGLILTDDIMFPIVVQRVRSGTPGNYEYRLPETSGELVFGKVIEALVKMLVTSQISRKIGLGI